MMNSSTKYDSAIPPCCFIFDVMGWCSLISFFMSKVSKFWVVTKPTKQSVLIDILFNADMKRMELQFKGGLSNKEIIGIFRTKNKIG